jgi:AmiR/NasT family two-component response regulator
VIDHPFLLPALNSAVSRAPVRTAMSHSNEEDELEREVDQLERRLQAAKSQLIFVTYQKNKQPKS